MKKNGKRFNIGTLPVMIDAFVEAYQTQYPLTTEDKDKIVAKIMHILQQESQIEENPAQVTSVHAYILEKMIRPLRVPERHMLAYFNWGMEWWEIYIPAYIRNIISNHKDLIDEYLKKRPRAFSLEDKYLWKIFIKNPYANPEQLAAIMGVTDMTVFNQACHSLINSCFIIYKTSRFKT